MSAVEASMGNGETLMGALEAYEAFFRGLGGHPWGGAIRFLRPSLEPEWDGLSIQAPKRPT
jgi:hypothetical protein